ncbi:MAG: DUF721 domain-containing protein [Elusimicrobia bacterium]|nr:DUF721 domain-containing protein [Elusimicrobiota bacterium]
MSQWKGPSGLGRWVQAGDALKGWQRSSSVDADRMAILGQVWEREAGHLAKHWALDGVRKGILFVKPSSPAAAQELQMRASSLQKALNKYFRSAWIKGIRPTRA